MYKRFSWYSKVKKYLYNSDFLFVEKELNNIKLKEIDNIAISDIFSIDTIIAYYFKLRIIERENSFVYENGNKILDQILCNIEDLNDY